MPFPFTELFDISGGHYPFVTESSAGFEGQRWFEARPIDPALALTHPDTPALGDPHPWRPGARCRSRSVQPSPRGGAWLLIQCTYATGSAAGGGFAPTPTAIDTALTLLGSESGSVPIAAEPSTPTRALREPVQIGFNRPIRRVRVRRNGFPWLSAFERLTMPEALNAGTVILPPIEGSAEPVVCPPKTLLAKRYDIVEREPDSVVVEFVFAYGPDGQQGIVRQGQRDPATGQVLPGTIIDYTPYPVVEYPPPGVLWPSYGGG